MAVGAEYRLDFEFPTFADFAGAVAAVLDRVEAYRNVVVFEGPGGATRTPVDDWVTVARRYAREVDQPMPYAEAARFLTGFSGAYTSTEPRDELGIPVRCWRDHYVVMRDIAEEERRERDRAEAFGRSIDEVMSDTFKNTKLDTLFDAW